MLPLHWFTASHHTVYLPWSTCSNNNNGWHTQFAVNRFVVALVSSIVVYKSGRQRCLQAQRDYTHCGTDCGLLSRRWYCNSDAENRLKQQHGRICSGTIANYRCWLRYCCVRWDGLAGWIACTIESNGRTLIMRLFQWTWFPSLSVHIVYKLLVYIASYSRILTQLYTMIIHRLLQCCFRQFCSDVMIWIYVYGILAIFIVGCWYTFA